MRKFALFGAKSLGFSKFMVCPRGQEGRGLNQCEHFTDKGRGDNFFAILCARHLWAAPKLCQLEYLLYSSIKTAVEPTA